MNCIRFTLGLAALAVSAAACSTATVRTNVAATPEAQPSTPSDSMGTFSGNWAYKFGCPEGRPEDCGTFSLELIQRGNLVCGTYFGAAAGLAWVDEGEIGTVIGVITEDVAVINLPSGRSGTLYLGTLRREGEQLTWAMRASREAAEPLDRIDRVMASATMTRNDSFESSRPDDYEKWQEQHAEACRAFLLSGTEE